MILTTYVHLHFQNSLTTIPPTHQFYEYVFKSVDILQEDRKRLRENWIMIFRQNESLMWNCENWAINQDLIFLLRYTYVIK